MFKADAVEATPIMQRALANLLRAAPTRGRPGADLRTACGDLSANAQFLIQANASGAPLAKCFDLAIASGVTQPQVAFVRMQAELETPVLLGAALMKEAIIGMCLAYEGQLISRMTFTSRDEVDALKLQVNDAFFVAEESAADEMDQMTYRALVELHAAIVAHLVDTARPLPRMLRFEFAISMPTLVTAQRLYYDASRADELRDENKVVHPAFQLPIGRALSN
jgi:prophage DNA circulation protein